MFLICGNDIIDFATNLATIAVSMWKCVFQTCCVPTLGEASLIHEPDESCKTFHFDLEECKYFGSRELLGWFSDAIAPRYEPQRLKMFGLSLWVICKYIVEGHVTKSGVKARSALLDLLNLNIF